MPLVLVHNEVVANPAHAWDDVEGVHYHYPSKYRGKIKTGEPFVYYRGVHRVGGKRGAAEYIGSGRIGEIWPDPSVGAQGKPRHAYYCGIDNYARFAAPVPAKIDGKTLEDIPRNLWRDGVRLLDPGIYARIIELAGTRDTPTSIDVAAVQLIETSDLIVPPKLVVKGGNGLRGGNYRRSKRAKEVGDWAESVVLRHIQENVKGCSSCTHRAALGETPGWDIDYLNQEGVLQRIEVKGTTAAAFVGLDLTAGELRAAKTHGQNYWLYLVGNCLTDSPRVQVINDPGDKLSAGIWSVTPALYTLRFVPPEQLIDT